ncbi:MAG: Zn-dependent hydrolase, partial [Boseongicola sp.]|nr:Zn-dependent hydrolase [Boseongicola sp.]
PKLVIPMHFRTLCYKPCDMHFISAFVDSFGRERVDFACKSTETLSRDELPSETRALVLDYL